MPLDKSIKKVLVIGSGPIVIGQAAEFDYSGTQACQAIKDEGIDVVLVNSNPATIMTDRGMATNTYIEPLTAEYVEKIIQKERPDSIIAGMGGQTGLNLACELYDKGVFEKYNMNVIGTSIPSIKEGEDRDSFKRLMERTNQPIAPSEIVTDVESGLAFAKKIGYPVIVRPAYTLGGTGGGIAEDPEQLETILSQGLHLSRVGQVLLEKSIKGWKEIEFEVMRDGAGNCITVCSMENIDPVGVHTGDSIVVAPALTLADKEYQMLRKAAIDIINSIEIKGGCNVQFALDPESFNYAVIEINPRVSRSSALASKATGYPIAKIAAKIALGYNLDEIKNAVTGKTYACFEPAIDYVVTKIPKWPFDKFFGAKRNLGTKMMATGEIMAIGNTLESSLLKGIRSLEIKQYTLERKSSKKRTTVELKQRVIVPDDERLFDLAELIRRNYNMEKLAEITGMDPFFLQKIKNIVDAEEELKKAGFTAYTIETATDDKVEEGYVISQSVDEGTAIPADEKIVITISEGKEDVEVPDVRGYSDDQATTLLTEAGFVVTHGYEYDDTVEKNKVISQSPEGKTMQKSGSTVKIIISNGKEVEEVEVPNLLGKSESKAANLLENAGLSGKVSHANSDEVKKGQVISQDVSAGSSVEKGSTVGYVISDGPEKVTYSVKFTGSITNSGFDFATFGNVTVNVTYTVGDATYKLYSGAAGEDSFPLDIGSADPIGGLSQNSGTFAVTITDSDGIDVTSSFNTSGLSASFSKE